ncbi:MAG: UPF0042 nucleotide-binding protein [Bradymonadia bacterium]|jgi:UPF0042 nucleotide-binding protein
MPLVLLTGLSGSGKTTALRALEDLGYFAMDNVPVALLPKVVELARETESPTRAAVVVDARDPQHLEQAGPVLDRIAATGEPVFIVYFAADVNAIIKRYNETRRRHPLTNTGDFEQAIELENSMLTELQHRADLTIDTSRLNVHELKRLMGEHFGGADSPAMDLRLVSFGHKNGPLVQADLLFDVRFLSNPYFVPELRPLSGLDGRVSTHVLKTDDARAFLEKCVDLLRFLLPRYAQEGKAYLTIGFGCTGGRHRSVALAEAVASALRDDRWQPRVEHRDRNTWPSPHRTES